MPLLYNKKMNVPSQHTKCNFVHLLVVVCLLVLYGCKDDSTLKTCYINGHITGLDGSSVRLVEISNHGDIITLDTQHVENGSFNLKALVHKPHPVKIILDEKYLYPIFLEPGDQNFHADFSSLSAIPTQLHFESSALNIAYTKWLQAIDSLEHAFDTTKQEYYLDKMVNLFIKDSVLIKVLSDSLNQIQKGYNTQYRVFQKNYIEAHSSSAIAPYILSNHILSIPLNDINITEMETLLDTIDPMLHDDHYYKISEQFMAMKKRLTKNAIAPDFSLKTLDDRRLSLADYRSKYIYLNFWAPWNGPSTKAFTVLKDIYNKYNSKGFEIISICDTPDEFLWKESLQEHNIPWPQTIIEGENNEDAVVTEIYHIEQLPTGFLIDPEGKILEPNISPNNLEEVLKTYININNPYK